MKFLATADLHIQTLADTRRLDRILRLAEERECAALLIGGDFLDTPFPEPEAAERVLQLLAGTRMQVYLAAGNHDPLSVTALYQKLPAQVQLFPAAITAFTMAQGIKLFGYSALQEQETRRPLEGFRAPQGETCVLLAHGQLDGNQSSSLPVTGEQLAASGFKLAVLGHVHKGEQRDFGGTRLLIPGIPEGRGWDETGEKYVYLIELDARGTLVVEPVSVAQVHYWEFPVDLTRCQDGVEILERMEALPIPENAQARLVLTGSPLVNPAAAARVYTEKYGREVWDETDPSLSVELLLEQNTLQGAFVRRAMAEINQASPDEKPVLEEALRLGLAALKEAKL